MSEEWETFLAEAIVVIAAVIGGAIAISVAHFVFHWV